MIYTDINTFPLHDAIPIDPDGVLIDTCGLDRIISFDPESGLLRCEAGILFSEILALAVPKGWFLPVTPGTRFVTLGGAIANDVHGKTHHSAGTIGHHLKRFELLRSDGKIGCASGGTRVSQYG